jgi:AcrR family transcriptional regulator
VTSATASGAGTKGERTQARILDAAVERFGTNGFRPTSVAAIARDAGVSAAAPFAYWPSKEALFEAAVDADARAVIAELLGGLGETDDVLLWLTLPNRLIEVLGSHPLARRVLAGQEPDVIDRVLEVSAFQDLRALLADLITADQARGHIRSDLDPKRAAIGMESITLALTMALLQLREPLNPDREAGVAEILLAAFRPPRQ